MQNRTFTDQLGREVSICYPPKRIVSLVPSQTELLFDLGLEEEIIGITKFCVHPKDKTSLKVKIGGTKTLSLEKIRKLKPDLILCNKEENERFQLECLIEEFPVWISDIYTLGDALNMIVQIGSIVGKEQRAESIAWEISSSFKFMLPDSMRSAPGSLRIVGKEQRAESMAREISSSFKFMLPDSMRSAPCSMPRIAYFIWKNPYMVAGTDTFINTIINLAGWQNVFGATRYPEISSEELSKAGPDIIFLSSEPYPFREKHVKEFQKICPGIPVLLVDGELFSWYGSRLQYTPDYIQGLKKQIDDPTRSAKSF